MALPSGAKSQSRRYPVRLAGLGRLWLAQLVRAPSDPRHQAAARRMWRQQAFLLALGAIAVVALMVGFDATEIGWMPPRGTPSLWPVRILTDSGKDLYVLCTLGILLLVVALMVGFDATEIGWMPPRGTPSLWPVRILTDSGKDLYVLCTLGVLLLVVALMVPLARTAARQRLLRLGTALQYLFLAVAVPVAVAEVIKWAVGRGRPFVGGKADAFNFAPFNGTEAYFSLPSAHAVTAAALAVGVAAIWPRTSVAMALYALAILLTRLVLLAHHPSDVVAGAVIGAAGALLLRYWFAARRLGFVIDPQGKIGPA